MTNTDTKQLLLAILEKAQEGKSLQFQFITSWSDFIYYWRLAKSNKIIIKALKSSANNLFKEYCKDVIAGVSNVDKLLAYVQLRDFIRFYEKDFNTLKQMLDEYDGYLGQGHFWYSFLGGERDL